MRAGSLAKSVALPSLRPNTENGSSKLGGISIRHNTR